MCNGDLKAHFPYMMEFQRIAILGPGFMGGSLALAAKRAKVAKSFSTWARRSETRGQLRDLGIFDSVTDEIADAVAGADLIVAATPASVVPAILQTASQAPGISDNVIFTDIASVKSLLHETISRDLGVDFPFVGSHPMAGSEKNGLAFAREDLFAGKVCVLTLPDEADAKQRRDVDRLARFWQAIGSRVLHLSPQLHDEIVARISHLPHAVAAALVLAATSKNPESAVAAATGYRSTTRVADGPDKMWAEIFCDNRDHLVSGIDDAIRELARLRDHLLSGDAISVQAFLAQARTERKAVLNRSTQG